MRTPPRLPAGFSSQSFTPMAPGALSLAHFSSNQSAVASGLVNFCMSAALATSETAAGNVSVIATVFFPAGALPSASSTRMSPSMCSPHGGSIASAIAPRS